MEKMAFMKTLLRMEHNAILAKPIIQNGLAR
jgi:hypothetical protein